MKAPDLTLHAQERSTSDAFIYRGTWLDEHDIQHGCEWWVSEGQSAELGHSRAMTMGYQRVVDEYIQWLNKEQT